MDPPPLLQTFVRVAVTYSVMMEANRMRITATCARVAELSGDKVEPLVPFIRPSALAQLIASRAKPLIWSASV